MLSEFQEQVNSQFGKSGSQFLRTSFEVID